MPMAWRRPRQTAAGGPRRVSGTRFSPLLPGRLPSPPALGRRRERRPIIFRKHVLVLLKAAPPPDHFSIEFSLQGPSPPRGQAWSFFSNLRRSGPSPLASPPSSVGKPPSPDGEPRMGAA